MSEPRFRHVGDAVVANIPSEERTFLSQVLTLLEDVGKTDDDPAHERLNVPVYLDDPDANDEWWRLMGEELAAARMTDRAVFERVMNSPSPQDLEIDEADAFLRVLNEGRLAFAARIGVEVEGDHDQLPLPEMQALDYLGWVLEELTAALTRSL